MFGWNKTEKHNQYSPTNQKVQREFNFPFSIQKSGYKVWFVLLLRMVQCLKPSLLSLRSQLWEDCGPWWLNAWLLGRMSDMLSSSRTPERLPRCWADRSRAHRTRRTGMWLRQEARTLCFFMGYTSRAKEGERRKSPIGKRSGVSP